MGTFESVGSINLNSFQLMPRRPDSGVRLFLVSIFRRKIVADDQGINEFGGLERSLLKRGMDISIICRSESYDEHLEEEHFYQVAMPNVKKDFLRKESRLASYKWLRSNSVILFDISTLGYEALGLGPRVGCISFQTAYRLNDRFGKPLEFGEKGPFWTNEPSEEEIGRILDYLLTVSDEQWERDSGWIRDQLMVHDYGNTKIRAYVEGVLTDSLESK